MKVTFELQINPESPTTCFPGLYSFGKEGGCDFNDLNGDEGTTFCTICNCELNQVSDGPTDYESIRELMCLEAERKRGVKYKIQMINGRDWADCCMDAKHPNVGLIPTWLEVDLPVALFCTEAEAMETIKVDPGRTSHFKVVTEDTPEQREGKHE